MPTQPSPMPALPHFVIAFAAGDGADWAAALQALPPPGLRHLGALLQDMQRTATDTGVIESLTPPHERVLARAAGLDAADGLIPWAAQAAVQQFGADAAGKSWSFITPCHWSMGRDHATLADPAALQVTEAESATLRADMQPYFATEGITLHASPAPGQWLAEGDVFRSLPTASLDRVLGRNVDPWLPGEKAGNIRRLQNEMQMLLYTHALNDERAVRRQLPINSVWLSGAGALPAGSAASLDVTLDRSLAVPAFQDDWQRWAEAWAALDAGPVAALLARQNAGQAVRLSLCGEHNALTFETARRGAIARLSSLFARPKPLAVLEQL